MGDELGKLPFAVALSRAARRAIRQNLFLSLGVVALLIPATLFGWAGIGVAVLIHEGNRPSSWCSMRCDCWATG